MFEMAEVKVEKIEVVDIITSSITQGEDEGPIA